MRSNQTSCRASRGSGLARLAVPVLLLLLLVPVALASAFTKEECATAGITHPGKLKTFVANLQKAVRQGDKTAVAAMIDYPISVPVDAADLEIENADAFLQHYDAIMTKAMQESLLGLQVNDITFNRSGALLAGDDARQLWATEGDKGITAYLKGI